MTPADIIEAFELLRSRDELREVGAYLVSHPSCHGNFTVGKLEADERCLNGGHDLTIPHFIAKLAFDVIRTALNERLSALGVSELS